LANDHVLIVSRPLGQPPAILSTARQELADLRVILGALFSGVDMLNRRLKFLALALGLSMAQGAVLAQDFLSKPVRIVVPQTPGGASDALARIVGQKLSEKWGQAVVIENRAGAGGNVGMELSLIHI
jgi:hypothetical protein